MARGALVCPRTHQCLVATGDRLVSEDRHHSYPYRAGVPHLLPQLHLEARYAEEAAGAMVAEYRAAPAPWWSAVASRMLRPSRDFRSAASIAAFEEAIGSQPPDALCLAIGGGPRRIDPRLTNLNIGAFPNVDVVGDAHQLPYASGAVDAIHCEAVLEHLELPQRAVEEMHRVLRPGGLVFAATPFLQGFHAYPNHFQNFTREGHDRLFQRAGFEIRHSGACVGPTFAVTDLAALYLRHYLPGRALSRIAQGVALVLAGLLRPLDRRLGRRRDAELLASTVYLLAARRA